MRGGFVSLLGAGPGDPELLTLKGLKRLQDADLVLYDALTHPDVLRLALRARRFFVGKRAHRPSLSQETINALLVRAARRGERVVRLKCGDPFVLGRGGEEALALVRAGVSFEVIPGVSSAVAAPALAGIPVTHRGVSSGFLVISGHSPAAWEPALLGLKPASVTVVILMGLAQRAVLARTLRACGWRHDVPVAILLNASMPNAHTWFGTLETLEHARLDGQDETAAGTIVIGDVVNIGHALAQTAPSAAAQLP
jgi:uroporphyrin-III C-methyltransferase/precorrin-2 dehydrogenase/sirohydrochlorin ferrochelatase